MLALFKLTAAAALALTTAGLSYLAAERRAEATTAFAETARKLQEAGTLSYRVSIRVPGQDRPTTSREFYKDPGLCRSEIETPQAAVAVIDTARGQVLTLDPQAKLALLQSWAVPDDIQRRSQVRAADATKHLRSLAAREGKPVGKRAIGGVEAEGFRVEDEGTSWTVWVDPARRLPLLMETTFRLQDRDVPATLSDFEIDPKLDDALFRLEPPRGYTLHKVEAPVVLREEALVTLLRLFADGPGGTFPPRPDDIPAFQARFPKEKWQGPADPKMIRLAQAMAASVVFLQFELKNQYGYRAEGVKLGDADKVLLWYRPKSSSKYRALFGDLHAEDVAADRLPEKPKF